MGIFEAPQNFGAQPDATNHKNIDIEQERIKYLDRLAINVKSDNPFSPVPKKYFRSIDERRDISLPFVPPHEKKGREGEEFLIGATTPFSYKAYYLFINDDDKIETSNQIIQKINEASDLKANRLKTCLESTNNPDAQELFESYKRILEIVPVNPKSFYRQENWYRILQKAQPEESLTSFRDDLCAKLQSIIIQKFQERNVPIKKIKLNSVSALYSYADLQRQSDAMIKIEIDMGNNNVFSKILNFDITMDIKKNERLIETASTIPQIGYGEWDVITLLYNQRVIELVQQKTRGQITDQNEDYQRMLEKFAEILYLNLTVSLNKEV